MAKRKRQYGRGFVNTLKKTVLRNAKKKYLSRGWKLLTSRDKVSALKGIAKDYGKDLIQDIRKNMNTPHGFQSPKFIKKLHGKGIQNSVVYC